MSQTYDLAIIGGGPAGVAAGVYASRKRLKTIFITKDFNGQSSVSDGIENWIGTVKISGNDLSKALKAHLHAYAQDIIDLHEGEGCESVTKKDDIFVIKTNKGSYEAKAVLVTTGSNRKRLNVPGADQFEHKGLTYCATCDGPIFADQDAVVIGGGNAAFESAAQLLAYCKSVTLLNRSGEYRADPVTVKRVLAHPKMKAIINAVPKEVKGDKFVSSIIYTDTKTGTDIELKASGIFVEIGSTPTTFFVKDIVELNSNGNVVTDPRTQRTSTLGIWAAGDCTDGLYHQNNIAAGDAVKALEDIYMYLHTQ
ncbi:MAG: FAD-dependent oxidoreductase [Patescibacteria group bacterium]